MSSLRLARAGPELAAHSSVKRFRIRRAAGGQHDQPST